VFEAIADDYTQLAHALGIPHVQCIPLSALKGETSCIAASRCRGTTARRCSNTWTRWRSNARSRRRLPLAGAVGATPDRSDAIGFPRLRGHARRGQRAPGDAVVVLPSGRRSHSRARARPRVRAMVRSRAGGDARARDEVDVSRGDVIAAADDAPEVSDQFAAHVLWMGDGQLLPGRPYWLKLGTRTVGATVTALKHKVDIDTQAPLAATHLVLERSRVLQPSLDQAIPFEPYARNRALGGFILIDRIDNATVAAGTLDFALRRAATCIGSTSTSTAPRARAARAGAALRVVHRLVGLGQVDGRQPRRQAPARDGQARLRARRRQRAPRLNRDLGFTDEDRVENLRRVAEVAKLMTERA
jgi:bifunctional enzyme CysN/CysC